MSRALGVRGFSATQTCTSRIAGIFVPELGALGLRREKTRRYGAPPRTALIAIGHQP
jgi:hypothetical protein